MLLLGNPAAGGTFQPLLVQSDRYHIFGGFDDTLRVLLRNFPLSLRKRAFENKVEGKEKLINCLSTERKITRSGRKKNSKAGRRLYRRSAVAES